MSATLYLPAAQRAASPVIFTMTPYGAQTYHDRGTYFASHGYPFLAVDVRGRGNSEGEFIPFVNEGRDGYDIVEWLAGQPYCNGQVAMWGGSYGGYVQWATAREFPPHLATIVPVAAPCIGVDFPIRNNMMAPYVLQWLMLVAGRTSQDRIFQDTGFWAAQFHSAFARGIPFAQWDSQLGHPEELFQDWLRHPTLDEYWDSCNPTAAQYARIDIPVLTITGSYDGDQPGALTHYREHLRNAPHSRHCLIIGPWDHAGTRTPQRRCAGVEVGQPSLVDLGELHLQWYAWAMQGGPRPGFLRKAIAYYVMAADEWHDADALEECTIRQECLYLCSFVNPDDVFQSGSLVKEPPGGGGPDHYRYDPRDIRLAALETTTDPTDLTDQRRVLAATGRQLVYHTQPFAADMEISGFFKLTAWLAIDQRDTDFGATVYEIALDGSSVMLSADTLRARYRESLREARLVNTHLPLRYDFERFTFVSRRVARGHRLRLVLGPLDSIYLQKNYNSGDVIANESSTDARPVSVSLFHDEMHPSALYVPVGRLNA